MRCARCGNENPETNRFCGMCGATLLQAAAAVERPASEAVYSATGPQVSDRQSSGSASAPVTVPASPAAAPAPGKTRTPAAEEPVISGPSFLGLNEPAPTSRRKGSLSIDPHSAPGSRNLDYLLEDDEETKGGVGKYILILLALVLAVGFGYLRWRNQGFAGLNAGTKKPAAAVQNAEGPDGTSTPPAPSSSDTNAVPTATATPTTTPSPSPAPPGPAAAGPAASSAPAPDNAAATAPPAASSGAPSDTASGTTAAGAAPPTAATPPPTADNPPAGTELPKAAAPAPAPKPHPAARPAPPRDPVAEAQKYLYGKGARQDCDRGMRLLKPAADEGNPKAMIEMGALYSAGLCAPRDLPTSYRWFALALRKDPNNQSVQTDLQKLWGEMTQPERQLAIRLSQ